MLCLELTLNGQKLATAGLPGRGVVSSNVACFRRPGDKKDHLHLSLGGLDGEVEPGDFLYWTRADLHVGDTVVVRVLKDAAVDPPTRENREQAEADRPRRLRLELKAAKERERQLERELKKLGKVRKAAPKRRAPKAPKAKRRAAR